MDDNLPTEEEINCFNKPTKQCKKCTNYCCSEHFPSHLDLLPDDDFEYFSSNEGLELYADESDDLGSNEGSNEDTGTDMD